MKLIKKNSESAFDGCIQTRSLDLKHIPQNGDDIFDALIHGIWGMKNTIQNELDQKNAIKVYFSLHTMFYLSTDHLFVTDPPACFNTEPVEIYKSTNLDNIFDKIYDEFINFIETFEAKGSGWLLEQFMQMDLHILQFNPLHCSTYFPLPEEIQLKHAVLNIQNKVLLLFF